MHVIKARQDPSKTQGMTGSAYGAPRTFATGSGLNQIATGNTAPSMPGSQRSVPPSTRAFAKDYAAFYGENGVTNKGLAQARAIKNGTDSSASGKAPDTRAFARAYGAFYDVDRINSSHMDKVRAIKNGGASSQTAVPRSYRVNTSTREDPNFRANLARFHGAEAKPEDEIYKNYRAFYGGATPNVNQAGHMGQHHKDQQRTLLRNKLAENAKNILNTKSFDDGFRIQKIDAKSQSQHLQDNGFSANAALTIKKTEEPASYMTHGATGAAAFNYTRNPKVDKVTKTDPAIKNLGKVRYNIVTGSLQEWF